MDYLPKGGRCCSRDSVDVGVLPIMITITLLLSFTLSCMCRRGNLLHVACHSLGLNATFVRPPSQTAPGGAAVRKHVEPDSPVAREEPAEAILLLMGPPALCGSFCVYGGWVGGPGHENDVRLVSRCLYFY